MQSPSQKALAGVFTGVLMNTEFQLGEQVPRKNPNRLPTVFRTAQVIQESHGMAPRHCGFFTRLLLTKKWWLIQPLYSPYTAFEQVPYRCCTGENRPNTGKYS
jgi:hypothetical protein